MKTILSRTLAAAVGTAIGAGMALAQQTPPRADTVFKNVTTASLKNLSVDDFMETMGVISAALAFDCSDCHTNAGTDKVNWAADTPRKVVSRVMIDMVARINKENFGGRDVITCWTCHHNRDRPMSTANFETIYGEAQLIPDDVISQAPGAPSAASVLDKFIEASGGAQKLASLKSIDATGLQAGFGGFGGGGNTEIVAQYPDKKSTIILFREETHRGDQIRAYDGKEGWVRTPLNILGEYQLRGGDLDGARFDAELMFPQQIKQILTNLKTGNPTTISDLPVSESQAAIQRQQGQATGPKSYRVNVVQGTGPRGLIVTLYFDEKTGLLVRELRYSQTPIGKVPVEVDFEDYRDVDGIKLPFHVSYVWLDGRDSIEIHDYKLNTPIEQAKFERPAPLKK